MLTTVLPKSMREDEANIGQFYRSNFLHVAWFVVPVALTAYFADLKWTLVAATAAVVVCLTSQECRLYDLIIRTQRTNKLLRQLAKVDE